MESIPEIGVINRRIGERLRLRRVMMNLSLEEVAVRLELSVADLALYEAGLARVPADRLMVATSVLGVPVGYFFVEQIMR